jgi:invasion protein IalB
MRLPLAFIAMALAACTGTVERANAQGAVKSVHNDWQVRCDTPPGALHEFRCLPSGCVAEVVMDDNLLKQLRAGQTATFVIFQTPEEGIGFPISLKGFGEGYDKLP